MIEKKFKIQWIGLIVICIFLTASNVLSADNYEPDNTAAEARSISVGGAPRQHDFHTATDEDWIRFWCMGGKDYSIKATNTGNSNLVIELFKEDGVSLIKKENWGVAGEEEILEFACPSDGEGIYLARIFLYDGTSFTGNNGYLLTVYHPTAPGTIAVTGKVREAATQNPIENIVVLSDSGEGYVTESDGFYELHLEPVQFCLQTKHCTPPASLYSLCDSVCYDTDPPQVVEKNIDLCAPPLTSVIEILKILCGAEISLSLNDVCDLNGDGHLGLEEATHILQKIAEIP